MADRLAQIACDHELPYEELPVVVVELLGDDRGTIAVRPGSDEYFGDLFDASTLEKIRLRFPGGYRLELRRSWRANREDLTRIDAVALAALPAVYSLVMNTSGANPGSVARLAYDVAEAMVAERGCVAARRYGRQER